MRALAIGVAALAACAGSPREDACRLDAPGAPWIAFAAGVPGHHDLALARADGTCRTPVTSGGDNLFPSLSPAGAVVFSTDRHGGLELRLHDLATGAERPLPVGPLHAAAPAFSPGGSALAFEARAPGQPAPDVYVMPAAGGPPVPLTDDPGSDAAPAWSPDGATIYFVSDRTGAREVFSVPAAGGAPTPLTSGSGILGRPAVSPDGAALAWARAAGAGGSEIVLFTLATGALRVVTGPADSEPAFDPSGARLAVRTLRWGVPAVALLDLADGGGVVRVTAPPDPAGTPAFAP